MLNGIEIKQKNRKWEVKLYLDGKVRDLGAFDDMVDAEKAINIALYILGFHEPDQSQVDKNTVGTSNYNKKLIQPWQIWYAYPELTSWDHDIIKRVLRTKEDNPRIMDYQKIIHICQERIRQIKELGE